MTIHQATLGDTVTTTGGSWEIAGDPGVAAAAEVDNKMTIAQEEIFGPVLSIIPYSSEEEPSASGEGCWFN